MRNDGFEGLYCGDLMGLRGLVEEMMRSRGLNCGEMMGLRGLVGGDDGFEG